MPSPFSWTTNRPADTDIVSQFPAKYRQDTTTLSQVLGTLLPLGTPTTGWRVVQNGNAVYLASNASLAADGVTWNRDDTSVYAYLINYNGNSYGKNGIFVLASAPAANPITNWSYNFFLASDGTFYHTFISPQNDGQADLGDNTTPRRYRNLYLTNQCLVGTRTAPLDAGGIIHAGRIEPSADGTIDLGNNTTPRRYRNLYLTGTANIGGGVLPLTTGAIDIGSSSLSFRNVYLTGNVYVNGNPISSRAPTRTILTSGSGTYTTPAGAKALKVMCVGGGGGGGNGGGTNPGGGGGSGGVVIKWYSSPAASYSYAVGGGGGAQGGGGNTTFDVMTAGGGGGGFNEASGGGGSASGGDINIPGNSGCVASPFGSGAGGPGPYGGRGGGAGAYGAGGGGGAINSFGSSGGGGFIIIEEYY